MGRSRKSRPRSAQKSLPVRKLSARMPLMRRYRPVPAVVFAIVVSALVGGFFGRSALAIDDKIPEHYKTFTAALSAIEANYVDKVESDSLVYSAIRGMLGTLDPHSSFFDPQANTRRCASGRKAATTASAFRFRAARRRHHGDRACSKDRRPTRRACAAATSSRRIGGERRQGLDHRAGDAEAARPEGHDGAHRAQAPRLRAADSARRDARRSLHPDRAGRTS